LSRIETNKLENLFLNKRQRKPKGQSRMDNAETVATLRRQYTWRRQANQKDAKHRRK